MPAATAIENTPDYWMVVLLRAIRDSDLRLAGEAQSELRRRGIDVRIGRLLDRQTPAEEPAR